MGRETRRGGFGPSRSSSLPPTQPHCTNGGCVHPTRRPILSLSSPLIVPFIIIPCYIICIIRIQYDLFFLYINCDLKSVYEVIN